MEDILETIGYLILLIIILSAIGYFVYLLDKHVEKNKKLKIYNKESKEKQNIYNELNSLFGIPHDSKFSYHVTGLPITINKIFQGQVFYIWGEGDFLKFVLHEHSLYKALKKGIIGSLNTNKNFSAEINLKDIIFFSRFGEFYTLTSGGGYNLSGAIIGGVIAGGAGAIIGSRNKIESHAIDKRNTSLTYNENGNVRTIVFDTKAFDIFLSIMPEKEISVVNTLKQENPEVMMNAQDDISLKINKLAELKANDHMTEEEFNERKKLLLDKFTS